MTHALQGECKTYRGCQSSGVTDSDSERQHEINMAVQTVPRQKPHRLSGRWNRHMRLQTDIRTSPSRTQHKCALLGKTAHCHAGLHTHSHRLIFAHIQNPVVRKVVSKAIYLLAHLLAVAHSPTKTTHTPRLTFIPAEPVVYLSLSTHQLGTGSLTCLSWKIPIY